MDKTDKGRGGGIESEVPLYIWCGCAAYPPFVWTPGGSPSENVSGGQRSGRVAESGVLQNGVDFRLRWGFRQHSGLFPASRHSGFAEAGSGTSARKFEYIIRNRIDLCLSYEAVRQPRSILGFPKGENTMSSPQIDEAFGQFIIRTFQETISSPHEMEDTTRLMR